MTRQVPLVDVAHILRGTVPAHASLDGAGHRFFGITEISNGGQITRRLDVEEDLGLNPVILLENDVVVAQLGKVGEAVLVDERAAGAVLGRECLALRLKPGKQQVLAGWLFTYLRSRAARVAMEQRAAGATMPRLSPKALADVDIPVPPVDDQRRIVAKLKVVDEALRSHRALVAALERLYDAELELAVHSICGNEDGGDSE